MKKYVVCDIGGSSIKYGLMDEEGHFIDKGKIVTPKSLGELYQALTSIYQHYNCLLYTSPSPRDRQKSRMPSSA